MFVIGDIILKIDHTAKFHRAKDLRHHVMLIVDKNSTGQPIIAHMTLDKEDSSRGTMVIETCPKIFNATYLHIPSLTPEARTTIQELAYDLHANYNLQISHEYIQKEFKDARRYHWFDKDFIDDQINALKSHPVYVDDTIINPNQFISCHALVVSIIHQACQTHNILVPGGINILPRLAWSDLLQAACKRCPDVEVTEVQELKISNNYDPRIFSAEARNESSLGCGLRCNIL